MLRQFLFLNTHGYYAVDDWAKSGIIDEQRQYLKTVFPESELNLTFSPIQREILSFLSAYTLFIFTCFLFFVC